MKWEEYMLRLFLRVCPWENWSAALEISNNNLERDFYWQNLQLEAKDLIHYPSATLNLSTLSGLYPISAFYRRDEERGRSWINTIPKKVHFTFDLLIIHQWFHKISNCKQNNQSTSSSSWLFWLDNKPNRLIRLNLLYVPPKPGSHPPLEARTIDLANQISLCTHHSYFYPLRSLPISHLLLLKVEPIKVSESLGVGQAEVRVSVSLVLACYCQGAHKIMGGSAEWLLLCLDRYS